MHSSGWGGTSALQAPFPNKPPDKVNWTQECFTVGSALLRCADSDENAVSLPMTADYLDLNYYINQFRINKTFLV